MINDKLTNEICNSGFIKAFIEEYFEYYTYSVYDEKDKLDFNLCINDKQKNKMINRKIKEIKVKIKSLGNYELSSAYLASCRKESTFNYIEDNERHKFWLNRFTEECESISVFFPVEYLFDEYFKENQNSKIEEFQEYFLDIFPKYFDENQFEIAEIIVLEAELKKNILSIIEEFKETKYWSFEFDDLKEFIPYNNSIKVLFDLSELLFLLDRFSIFNDLQEIVKSENLSNKELIEKNQPDTSNIADNTESMPYTPTPLNEIPDLRQKIEKHFAFFNGDCPRTHTKILNNEDYNNLIKWTFYYYNNNFKVPEIDKPIRKVNTNKTFVQFALRALFKELHNGKTYPKTLFTFYISVFERYKDDKESNFNKVKGKGKDELKKLMKL